MSQTQLSDEKIRKTQGTDLQSVPERSAFRPVARLWGALPLRTFLPALMAVIAMVFLPQRISAQDLELSGGYTHVTQNFGTDGFDVGAAWWFTPKITIGANYDSTWDTSQIGVFQITNVGLLVSKAHLQSALIGPRIFFFSHKIKKYKLSVFGETQYGASHIHTTFQQAAVSSVSSSDTSFTWTLGGGADYPITPHWSGRANVDFMRTHFAAAGQSRLRLVLGIAYTFGSREK
jgi:long-subunit fatty acid transport protein